MDLLIFMIDLSFNNVNKPWVKVIHFNSKQQPHRMVKQTQTICRQQPTNCLSVFDHFVGLALKSLTPPEA